MIIYKRNRQYHNDVSDYSGEKKNNLFLTEVLSKKNIFDLQIELLLVM